MKFSEPPLFSLYTPSVVNFGTTRVFPGLNTFRRRSASYPLRVRSSSVLRQIHRVNERPQRAGNIRLSARKLDEADRIRHIFGCIEAVQMELDGRMITEYHQSYTRLVSADLHHLDNTSDKPQDGGKSVQTTR